MPNIKSAKKRMELSRRYREANRKRRGALRTALKRVRAAETKEEGEQRLREAYELLDRAAGKRLVHPNKADRLKSQLAKQVESL